MYASSRMNSTVPIPSDVTGPKSIDQHCVEDKRTSAQSLNSRLLKEEENDKDTLLNVQRRSVMSRK